MKFKWKSPAEKSAEQSASANWNTLVSRIIEADASIKPEEITPDSILESMEESASGGDETELQSQLTAANTKVAEQAATITQLEATVAEQKVKLGADGAGTADLNKGTDTVTEEEKAGAMIVDDAMSRNIAEAKSLFVVLPD
jgi:hypothetical protein